MTRDEAPDGPLSESLRAAGLTVVHEPVLARAVVSDAGDEIRKLDSGDWLVLTSVYAIESVAQAPARIPRVAVVGDVTRKAAVDRGFRVELVSPDGTAASLFESLSTVAKVGRVCYPRSSRAAPPLPWNDVELTCPVLYETVNRAFDKGVIDRVDAACVASPSAVEAMHSSGIDLSAIRLASIGPTTSAMIRAINLEPWLEAPQRSFQSLAGTIAESSWRSESA